MSKHKSAEQNSAKKKIVQEPVLRWNAKIALITLVNDKPSVIVLTKRRHGKLDWAGGRGEPGEQPDVTCIRELQQELPGVRLRNMAALTITAYVNRAGEHVTSHLYAGVVDLPKNGLQLSDEHTAVHLIPLDTFDKSGMPERYRHAVAAGRQVIDNLIALADGTDADANEATA